MKRQLIPAIILFLALLFICVMTAFAVDTLDAAMPIQGFLANFSGVPVPDGPHTIVFTIYNDSIGGTPKWTETHMVNTKGGMWSVRLGDINKVPDSTINTPKVFLGMKVGTDPEMTPRTRLGATPFARFSAGINGHIRTEPGKIRVMATDTSTNAGVEIDATGVEGSLDLLDTADTFRTGINAHSIRLFKNGTAIISADATGVGGSLILVDSGDADRTSVDAHGISLSTGARATTVAGLSAQGLTLTAGASDGYVLTTNASGLGTWKPSTGGGSSCWLCPTGNYTYLSDANDSVGIGTSSPTAKLDVEGNIHSTGGLNIGALPGPGNKSVININRGYTSGTGDVFAALLQFSHAGSASLTGTTTDVTGANGDVTAVRGTAISDGWMRTAVIGSAYAATNASTYGNTFGVSGTSRFGDYSIGVKGYAYDGNVAIGVHGSAINGLVRNVGVVGDVAYSSGDISGVEGWAQKDATGTGVARGGFFSGYNDGTSNAIGVYALATGTGSGTHYGVYGLAEGSGPKYAGYFAGDVNVTGTLSKAGGSFKIDHPLDPENKYLQHSFVESPDMKNIYDGNVTTGADGKTVVTLPDYFTALNRDFRYQLTVIGQFSQAIVAEEISNNRFTIQTDKPNVKVSWQVTGIRKDAWAEKNRIQVEVDKKPEEKGKYLHPEAFGKPIEQSVNYEQIKAARDAKAPAPATSPDMPRR